MSTLTSNYKLIKPELTDPADITSMNENWNKIDSELKRQADAIPDVSGQISIHNADTSAHQDIRTMVNNHSTDKSNPHGVTAEQIGADSKGAATTAVNEHNNNSSAHSDIRAAVSNAATAASNAQTTANSKASTVTYTASVNTSWSASSAGGYYKTVTVSGMLASDNPIADVVLGSDVNTNALYLEAWACITRITTAANSITLYANDNAPTSAFTVQLKVVR